MTNTQLRHIRSPYVNHGLRAFFGDDQPKPFTAKLIRLLLQRPVAFKEDEANRADHLLQLSECIDSIDCLFALHLTVANHCVARRQLRGGRIVTRLVQKVLVSQLHPEWLQRLRENALRGQVSLEDELSTWFQGVVDGLQKREVARIIEVGEAVAETERMIERRWPGEI